MAFPGPAPCITGRSRVPRASTASGAPRGSTCVISGSRPPRTWAFTSSPGSTYRSTSPSATDEARPVVGSALDLGGGGKCPRLPLHDPARLHAMRDVPHRSLGRDLPERVRPSAERAASQLELRRKQHGVGGGSRRAHRRTLSRLPSPPLVVPARRLGPAGLHLERGRREDRRS